MSGRPSAPPPPEIARFLAVVPHGKANALTAADICRVLGYVSDAGEPTENHKRRVRLLAQHAVKQGLALVCGDDAGYFVPAAAGETRATETRFENQMARMSEHLRAVRRLKAKLFHPEQMPLW